MAFERLRASLELDTSGFRSGVRDAQKDMDSLQDRASNMGRSLQKSGAVMTAGITAPLTVMGSRALSAAADAEELRSRAEAVFGDMTSEVEQWAEVTADEMGRSENQLLDMAATMQDMLDPTGEATEEVMHLSMGMAELAEDVASFQNMQNEEVMSKFMSAMAGQSRAVRDLGVDMSAAAVEAELLEMGIEGGAEAASDAEEAQARYNILMDQTQAAHGDAARTADTFTGSMRQVRARTADLAAEFGQHLLPAATLLAQNIGGLITMFDGLSHRQQQMVVAVAGLAAALGPLLLGLGTLVTLIPVIIAGAKVLAGVIAVLTGPIGLVVLAIAALAIAWQQDLFGMRDVTEQIITRLRELFNGLVTFLGEIFEFLRANVIDPFLGWLVGIWEQHGEQLMAEVTETWGHIQERITAFVEWVKPYVLALTEFLTLAFRQYWDIVSPMFETHLANLLEIFKFTFEAIKTYAEAWIDIFVSSFRAFLAIVRGDWREAWNIMAGLFTRNTDRILGLAGSFGDMITNIMSNTVEGIIGVFRNLYDTLVGNSIVPDMFADIEGVFDDFLTFITSMWRLDTALSTTMFGAMQMAIKTLRNRLGGARDTITDFTGRFKSAGKALATAVADGIRSGISDIDSAARSAASSARDKLPGSDAKEGPLSDLTDAGKALPETLVDGMDDSADGVDTASARIAARARPSVDGQSSSGSGSNADIEAALKKTDRTDDLLRKLDALISAVEDEMDVDVTVDNNARYDPF